MIDLQKVGNVYVLTMDDGENRWNTTFVAEIDKALDEVEASTGPAALVTRSSSEKFFSNGLDLDWLAAEAGSEADVAGGDKAVFGSTFMALMGRIITFPMPTIAAINGHAFGAGFMSALCHDVRVMRADRGFICANEMQLGMAIPRPELALFRHKLPANVFHETVQLARRWSGTDAHAAGIVQHAASAETLLDLAMGEAERLAPLAANREVFGAQKEMLYGASAAINEPHGPAHMLKHSEDFR